MATKDVIRKVELTSYELEVITQALNHFKSNLPSRIQDPKGEVAKSSDHLASVFTKADSCTVSVVDSHRRNAG